MSKADVLAALETDMNDPGSYKSGEYLEDHILMHARQFLFTDRTGLIKAMRKWINLRSDPRTMLAVKTAHELGLKEILPDIELLRLEIANGKIFKSFYLHEVDDALRSLR